MEEIAISEFKAKCLALLEQVGKTKKPIRVTRFGRPVAYIVAQDPGLDRFHEGKDRNCGRHRLAGDRPERNRGSKRKRLKLLLDTHIWQWTIGEPQRLGRRVLRELTAPGNEVWLSPISLWEALLLVREERIRVATDLSQWLEASASKVREAVLTHEVVAAADQLQMHADPADRFLAATAKVLGLTLVTADHRLRVGRNRHPG